MAPNTGIASAGGRSLDPAMLHTGKWWNHSHIVKLNLLLIIPLITSYANGFDGSMMNGLQSVERWKAGLSSIIQLLFVWFLPESPRWLINRGRDEEAKAILARYHAGGDGSHPLISFEYNEIKEAIALEAEAARVSWLDLFRTPGNRRRMRIILGIGVFSQLSGNGIISYYLTKVLDGIGITSSNDQTLVNGILAIFNFIVATGASMTVERVGRRPFFIISTAVGAGRTLLAFVFIFNGFYDIAYTPLLVSYTVEILPFLIRAKGLAAMNFSVMGSIIFNQYTNPIAFAALKWKYYLVYTIWLVFELVYVWLWATETKGRSLEETAALFDGEDAVAELSNRTGHDMAQLKHDGSDSQDEKLNIEHSKREIA
ncbi:SubName: Full=Related to hexose transporter protein {ECO:0000313/EMBL:CCA69468.1} [Serendipita indica DSM 11827]|nr:SubName: Full=Related to hexose transporter protein {ECO:0000313/EMBL:CCA69468.1} [Serendipita indica DSM 11827]